MYNKESLKAEEFINHEEILKTLDYAEKNKNNYIRIFKKQLIRLYFVKSH